MISELDLCTITWAIVNNQTIKAGSSEARRKMKIKALSPKILAYYLALATLAILVIVIVIKLMFLPPCVPVSPKNDCAVDSWSIAGLAATILGVGAAILTLLGAFAVAYWWANLNQKVDQRVDEQVKKAIDQALQVQGEKISEQTALLLGEQEKKLRGIFSDTQKDMDALRNQASTIENRVLWSIKQLIIAMTQLDPWMIEPWASQYQATDPSSEVAVRMVLSYLRIVDGFFPTDPYDISAIGEYQEGLRHRSAPAQDPVAYWNNALIWQRQIEPQLQPTHAETARRQIEKRRPLIETWMKQQEQN